MDDLVIDNAVGGSAFFSEDGLDSSVNVLGDISKSSVTKGSLDDLESLSEFSVTFWVKIPVAQSGFQNILAVASSDDPEGGLLIRLNSSKGGNANKIEVLIDAPKASGILALQEEMTPSPNGEWRFFAISYDGTSARVDQSEKQAAATEALQSENRGTSNLQIYQASAAPQDVLLRQGFHWGKKGGQWIENYGALSLGKDVMVFLGNEPHFSRGLVGLLKDVRIYPRVLTMAEIEAIRSASLPTTDERP